MKFWARRAAAMVLSSVVLAGCARAASADQQAAAERLAQAVADRLPGLMAEGSVLDMSPQRWVSDVSSVDGIDHFGVYDGAAIGTGDPDSHEKVVGVDIALGVDFTDRAGTTCVVLAATSTGGSDAVVAVDVPLTECENPPGRLGRAEFASARDLLRRDGHPM